ncbi:hypothetical protein J1605_005833 [Eschrichtius robustus]|uniref:Uncharacterized protein n=1 Tax=Eschrichtius robustus TaxID=9764 RepID=A0AB34H3A8_ESCRO|nr:hypothetical protein J1605_005833 [Eschrichtius robustus]
MDPSYPEVQALLAIHFIAQSDPDIRRKIQKATAGPQTPMNDLFQLAYLVFSNRDMAKKAECTQRNMQKAQVIAVALSAQRPPKEKLAFLGESGPADHKAHGYPYKSSVLSVDRGGTGGRIVIDVSSANSQGIGRGNAPDASE